MKNTNTTSNTCSDQDVKVNDTIFCVNEYNCAVFMINLYYTSINDTIPIVGKEIYQQYEQQQNS